jgi:hypothetical protein
MLVGVFAKRFAQHEDGLREVGFFDGRMRPEKTHQLGLRDDPFDMPQ